MSTPSEHSLPEYVPSGRVGVRGWLVMVIAGSISALLLGALYVRARGAADGFVTIALCDLLFMAVVTFSATGLVRAARSRSPAFNRIAAASWLVLLMLPWWWVAMSAPTAGLAVAGSAARGYAALATTVAMLAIEAMVVGLAAVYVVGEHAKEPYSEAAQVWAKQDFVFELALPSGDSASLLRRLGNRGVAALLQLPPAESADAARLASTWSTLRVSGHRVEADAAARWVALDIRDSTRDDGGRIRTATRSLCAAWTVDDDGYRQLRAMSEYVDADDDTADDPVDESGATEVNAVTAVESAPIAPELDAALSALNSENYAVAYAMARGQCAHPDTAVSTDAKRLCAQALSRLERWPEAFDNYHALFDAEPSAFNALQLASTSVMAGELLRGEAWFARAYELNDEDRSMAPVRMRTGYLAALERAGETTACVAHLEWMRDMYQSLDITDSHLLWMHDIPPFSEFLWRSRALLADLMTMEQLRDWYRVMTDRLPEEWRTALDEHLERLV